MSASNGHANVAIVGGGPAGLAAAAALRRAGAGRVVVLDREEAPGGIPRHAHHHGYGLRDLHRSMTGPAYAEQWSSIAADAGAELRTAVQATGWATADAPALELTSPLGREVLTADAVVLATGCRERPRSARLVAGSRPQGVMTTGMLQQLVYLLREPVGSRAVVVGAEHVSFSAVLTLAHGGARTVAMVTDQPRHQSYAAFRLGAGLRFGTPVLPRSEISAIRGRRRVESVEVTDLDTGARRDIACDLVIFTADWIPDHELAVLGGIGLDRGTRGPAVDAALRTDRPGVFATGNVLHGAETADVAALTGRHVADGVTRWLRAGEWPAARIEVRCDPPLHWITPNAIVPDDGAAPARKRFLVRAHAELIDATIEVRQDGRALWRGTVPRVMPGRSARLPTSWTAAVRRDAGPVDVRVLSARRR